MCIFQMTMKQVMAHKHADGVWIHNRPVHDAVTQAEIEGLYKRFRALDRGRKVHAASLRSIWQTDMQLNRCTQHISPLLITPGVHRASSLMRSSRASPS